MSNTVFQIRRSNTTATPTTTLFGGELAYSYNTNSLFIGAQTGVGGTGFRIGGSNYSYLFQSGAPGVLTANAVPITDSNSYMNNTFTQGLAIQTSTGTAPNPFISSLSNVGTSVLGANGSGGGSGTELVTSAAIVGYVTTKLGGSSIGGANTQIEFNDSGSFNGLPGFTYTKTTNTVFVGNTLTIGSTTTLANQSLVLIGNVVVGPTVNTTANAVLYANSTDNALQLNYWNGNSSVNTYSNTWVNASVVIVGNSASNSRVNSTAFAAGQNAYLSTTQLFISANVVVSGIINTTVNTIANGGVLEHSYWNGNSSVNTYSNTWINATSIIVGNSVGNVVVNTVGFSVNGAFTANSTLVNAAALNVVAQTNSATLFVTTTANVGTAVQVNTTAYGVFGTATVGNATINSTVMSIGNSTIYSTANQTTDIWVGAASNAIVNNTIISLVGTATVGSVVHNTTAINIGNSTVNATINSTSWNGSQLTANVTMSGANVLISSTNATSTANTTLAGTNTVISSNLTVTSGLITAASSNLSIQNITVSGNLTVSGTVTTINTAELVVNSNFIQLADLNKTTDTVDEGFFGTVGNTTATYYPFVARIASLSTLQNPYFYLGATKNNPNTASTIDLSAANTFTGTVAAYLAPFGAGGGFVVNSSTFNVQSNGTWSATLAVNTLALTTALSPSYGGTGQLGGYSSGDVLYATGASAISRLGIGTNGYVLQVTSNLPAWGVLDGGTF